MDPTARVRRNPDVVARPLSEGEGGVLLHLKSGAYHGMNQVGLLVWELIDGERTVTDILDAVRANVVGGPPELEADISGFLIGALERDLVQVVEAR